MFYICSISPGKGSVKKVNAIMPLKMLSTLEQVDTVFIFFWECCTSQMVQMSGTVLNSIMEWPSHKFSSKSLMYMFSFKLSVYSMKYHNRRIRIISLLNQIKQYEVFGTQGPVSIKGAHF